MRFQNLYMQQKTMFFPDTFEAIEQSTMVF
jgi:hypothetical protein